MQTEPESTQSMVNRQPAVVVSSTKRQLLEFLQDNTAPLLSTLRSYVQRLGLAMGEEVQAVALEVLQEAVIEALAHADRFDATRAPMAWLLGIAANVIKRKKVEKARYHARELLLSRLSMNYPEAAGESDVLDLLTASVVAGPEQIVEANEQANALLSLVSADDQQVLRLAFLNDFDGESMAQRLGITIEAARMRLHRALARLRSALREQQQLKRQRGEEDE